MISHTARLAYYKSSLTCKSERAYSKKIKAGGDYEKIIIKTMRYTDANVNEIPQVIRDTLKNNTVEIQKDDVTKKVLSKGMIILGNTGTGKTYAFYAIAKVLSTQGWAGGVSNIENWVEFLFELKDRGNKSVKGLMDDFLSNKYIFIDDLGAEQDKDWGKEMLYLVINKCYKFNKILFINTNLDNKQLIERYGERILDRVSDMVEVVEMPNKNYRD